MTFGPYDLIVLAVLGVGFFHGRSKGLAWQLSGIATLALGYVAASAGAAFLAPIFPDAWPLDAKKFVAWVATYAIVCAAVYVVTLKVSKKLKENELEELDRRFGGGLGALKAALLLAIVSLAAVATSERARSLVKESASGQALARVAYTARPLLPDKIGDAVGSIAGKIAPEPEPNVLPAAPAPKAPPKPLPRIPVSPQPTRPLPGAHRLEQAPPPPPPPSVKKPAADEDGDEPGMDDDGPPEPKDPLAPR